MENIECLKDIYRLVIIMPQKLNFILCMEYKSQLHGDCCSFTLQHIKLGHTLTLHWTQTARWHFIMTCVPDRLLDFYYYLNTY